MKYVNSLPALLWALLLLFATTSHAQALRNAFVNGRIYTVNEKYPWAESVVVQNDKIIFAGSTTEAQPYIDKFTEIVDLGGKLMLPGFIDNHTHFTAGGFYLLGIDLRPAKSTDAFKNIIREYAKRHEGKWITGGSWDHEAWEIKELPRKEWIDEFTPATPVFLIRFDGHMALANSYALKLAGITKDTKSPDGGVIVKDPKTGEPTGMLKDKAMELVDKVIPLPSEKELGEASLAAIAEANRFGVTSVQDMASPYDLAMYQKLEKEGRLNVRFYCRLPIDSIENIVHSGVRYAFGSNKIKVGSFKGYADGSLGSSTALFFEPYNQDKTTHGLAMEAVNNGKLRKWSLLADKNKFQLCIHAIGDSANFLMLKLFEDIIKTNPSWDRRFRIEHAQHVRFDDIKKFAALGVIASVQPYHAIDDGVWAEKRIGKRILYTYPFKSFLDAGVKMCFGSDWTVAPINPLLGIYAAVTRRTLDEKNPNGWIPEQKISVSEAVKCYTINNAYAAFEEKEKGSIEIGKLADFVVLSDNIFDIDPVQIKDVQVEMTILGGNIIYRKK